MLECLSLSQMYLITRVGSLNNAPQKPEADRHGTRTTAPSAASKSTEDSRPHILVTTAHPFQQKKEGGPDGLPTAKGRESQRVRGNGQSTLLEPSHPGMSRKGPPSTRQRQKVIFFQGLLHCVSLCRPASYMDKMNLHHRRPNLYTMLGRLRWYILGSSPEMASAAHQ